MGVIWLKINSNYQWLFEWFFLNETYPNSTYIETKCLFLTSIFVCILYGREISMQCFLFHLRDIHIHTMIDSKERWKRESKCKYLSSHGKLISISRSLKLAQCFNRFDQLKLPRKINIWMELRYESASHLLRSISVPQCLAWILMLNNLEYCLQNSYSVTQILC